MSADFWGKFLLLTALFVVWVAAPRARVVVAGSMALIGLDATFDLPARVVAGDTVGVSTAFFYMGAGGWFGRWIVRTGRHTLALAERR